MTGEASQMDKNTHILLHIPYHIQRDIYMCVLGHGRDVMRGMS